MNQTKKYLVVSLSISLVDVYFFLDILKTKQTIDSIDRTFNPWNFQILFIVKALAKRCNLQKHTQIHCIKLLFRYMIKH